MSSAPDTWYWADGRGVKHRASALHLLNQLRQELIPADAFVWRQGWTTWHRANAVRELRSAVPGRLLQTPVKPTLDASVVSPPALPEASKGADTAFYSSETLLGPVNPVQGEAEAVGAAASPLEPAGKFERSSVPTLIDLEEKSGRSTLRPPGAIPPPPRRMPGSSGSGAHYPAVRPADETAGASASAGDAKAPTAVDPTADPSKPERVTAAERGLSTSGVAEKPAGAETAPAQAMGSEAPKADEAAPEANTRSDEPILVAREPADTLTPLQPNTSMPSGVSVPAQLAPSKSGATLLGISDGTAVKPGGVAPSEVSVSSNSAPPAPKKRPVSAASVAIGVLSIMCAVLLVTVILLLVEHYRARQPAATAQSAGPTPASARPQTAAPAPTRSAHQRSKAASCALSKPAALLSDDVQLRVPPLTATLDDGARVAVGLLHTQHGAMGLSVDTNTVEAKVVFKQRAPGVVHGVVPLTAGKELTFAVDGDDSPLLYSRTLDTKPPRTFGLGAGGLSMLSSGDLPELIWATSANEFTSPRVAPEPRGRLAIALRSGGQGGRIHIGWMGPNGARHTPLVPVSTRELVGKPALGANRQSVAVAVAARESAGVPWRVLAASAPHGRTPAKADPVDLGTADKDHVFAPSIAGLARDQWLLQWTEGSSGSYRVRVQPLDGQLNAIAHPITVSPAGAKAGQGTIWAAGNHALSLFVVSKGQKRQLWGAALKCR